MQEKGFIVNLYYLNLDSSKLYLNNSCGSHFFSYKNYELKKNCSLPLVNEKNFKKHTSKKRIKHILCKRYLDNNICNELNLLLELYDIGIITSTNKIYNKLNEKINEIDSNDIKLII